MNQPVIFSILLSLITIILASLAFMLSKKNIQDREKNSQFECGFDPFSTSRLPFSLRFFMIAIIFLIFDVEIALLLPLLNTIKETLLSMWLPMTAFFLLILTAGTLFEWKEKSLDWK